VGGFGRGICAYAILVRANLITGQALGYSMDRLGPVRLLVNAATRQIVDTCRYAPFGGLLAGGVSNNTCRFTGETQDATGLLYLRVRYYDPTTGRFLTRELMQIIFLRVPCLQEDFFAHQVTVTWEVTVT